MAEPTTILGKVGKKVGEELKGFRSTSDNKYATQVSLGSTDRQVSINSSAIVSLGNASSRDYVTKVSLNNYKTGVNVFTDLSATRASIGDLTVTGTTTTLNTQTVVIEDNIIELNLRSDGAENAQTSGIQINRGEAVASVNETLGNGVTNFVANPVDDYLLTMSWDYGGTTFTYSVGDTLPTGNETDSHLGKMQSNGSWMSTQTADHLDFEYDNDGNLSAIDKYTLDTESGQVSVIQRIVGFNYVGGVEDKAKFIWNDNSQKFQVLVGDQKADFSAKVLNASEVNVPSASGFKINTVAIGDYSIFLSALNTAKA